MYQFKVTGHDSAFRGYIWDIWADDALAAMDEFTRLSGAGTSIDTVEIAIKDGWSLVYELDALPCALLSDQAH